MQGCGVWCEWTKIKKTRSDQAESLGKLMLVGKRCTWLGDSCVVCAFCSLQRIDQRTRAMLKSAPIDTTDHDVNQFELSSYIWFIWWCVSGDRLV